MEENGGTNLSQKSPLEGFDVVIGDSGNASTGDSNPFAGFGSSSTGDSNPFAAVDALSGEEDYDWIFNLPGSNPSAEGSNPSAEGSNPSASGSNPFAEGSNPFASGGNPSAGDSNPFASLFAPSNNPFALSGIPSASGGNAASGNGNYDLPDSETPSASGGNPSEAGSFALPPLPFGLDKVDVSDSNTVSATDNETIGNGNWYFGTDNETIGNGNWYYGDNNATLGNGNWYLGKNNQVIGNGNKISGDDNVVLGNSIGSGITSDDKIIIGNEDWLLAVNPEAINGDGDNLLNGDLGKILEGDPDQIDASINSLIDQVGTDFLGLLGGSTAFDQPMFTQGTDTNATEGCVLVCADNPYNMAGQEPQPVPETASSAPLLVLGLACLLWLRFKRVSAVKPNP